MSLTSVLRGGSWLPPILTVGGKVHGNTSSPADAAGSGAGTVSHVSTGIYRISFGTTLHGYELDSLVVQLGADTPADVDGWSAIVDSNSYASGAIDVNFYSVAQSATAATATLTACTKTNATDGDYFTLSDGNESVLFELDKTGNGISTARVGRFATWTIQCATKANMVDGEILTIPDPLGGASVVYEFDVAGDGVTAGRVQVNIAGATTAADVAAILYPLINTNSQWLTAVDSGSGLITITSEILGTASNVTITENVTHASFVVTATSLGMAATETGRVLVDISAVADTAAGVAGAIHSAINNSRDVAITSVDNANGTLTLTNSKTGAAGNATNSENVTHASFLLPSFTGGADQGVTTLANLAADSYFYWIAVFRNQGV